ncbi:MAG: hypothetical protein ACI4D1_11180 [Lachnospira sp.]
MLYGIRKNKRQQTHLYKHNKPLVHIIYKCFLFEEI